MHFPYVLRSGIDVVMTLGFKLWPGIIIARHKHASFKTCHLSYIVDFSIETALITTLIPLRLVE